MLGQSILVALLVTCVSAQEAPTNQLSRSTYLPDRSQSSWSSLPNSFNDNFDAIPHNERTIGSSSLFRNQDSLLQKAGQSDSADLGSLNFRNLGSSSFLRNQGSLLEPGGVPVSPYRAEPYSLGSSLSGSRFMDTTMRSQGMLNGNSWMNRNGMSPRGLNMHNLQTQRNRGLSGFPSDGSSSVLAGSSLGDDVSGFSRNTPWDISRGTRPLNAFPYQYSESRNLNVPPLSMGQRQRSPWRLLNTQNVQRGMGQLGLNRDSGLGLNRLNMQRGIQAGEFNLLGDLGVNRQINDLMTPNRRSDNNDRRMDEIWISRNRGGASFSRGSDNINRRMDEISVMNNRRGASLSRSSGNNDRIMDEIWILRNRGGQSSRSLLQNGMIPMSRSAPLTTLPSTSQGPSLLSGLGPRTAMGRSSNLGRLSSLSSKLATAPLRSTGLTQTSLTPTTGRVSQRVTSSLIRGISSGPRLSGTTVYQPSSGGQRQGIRRLSAF